jgi:hypothetical protein
LAICVLKVSLIVPSNGCTAPRNSANRIALELAVPRGLPNGPFTINH